MPNNQSFSTQTCSPAENIISEIIERYKDHPSIYLIKFKVAAWPTHSILRQSQLKKRKDQSNLLT